ncbi:sigma-70 family RNA polymerase sigma factor [Lysinibacillus agricola]|uniref:Sigma-70 family RNA polymerase sigma factor n=1 Tax=Lysinibacillus agricola TaxID=2590012 RepID=A0ABX7AN15_9BACI|nr:MULTISPECIES: sigma-70 family RNA polymerase sigma factor [Lysinibacillus]KOS60480.1 RNA polymerase subunit sigma [Lysinibacillus sp. FJAT-14222]QQP10278.1 sigma-70 family RNA polymerase sigma factor [Lysinibacillus agricola]
MESEFLVKKAQKGDGEAFIQLVRQYELILYRTAKRLGLTDEDIADLLQETVLTAFEKIGTLKEVKYFNTWLCRILLNNCYRFMKQHKQVVPLDSETLNALAHQDNLSIELDDALNSLDENYRIALTLYYVSGLTTKEISEFLHEPEGTIKSRISRAKQHLKNNYYVEEAQPQ